MSTIEQHIEQWARQKRQTLSMTEQEGVRIWNVIQSQIILEDVPRTGLWSSITSFSAGWRWSLVPAIATVFMMMAVIHEGNGNISTPDPLQIETVSMNAAIVPSSGAEGSSATSESVADNAVLVDRASTIRTPSARRVSGKRIVATRDQTVFVAWATSVYGPGGNYTIESGQNPWGKSVYTE